VLESTDVAELYDNAIDKIAESIATFQRRKNNWQFASVVKLEINSIEGSILYSSAKGTG